MEEFHPPVVLLPRILQKVRSDRATALLVAPDWPDQPWYAQIQQIQGEAVRLRGSPPAVVVSQSDCMADVESAFRAAGFPEEVTNVLLTS